jgi:hypothetical protein
MLFVRAEAQREVIVATTRYGLAATGPASTQGIDHQARDC